MRRLTVNTITQIVTVLGVAYALKYHYSVATVNALRWILEPTRIMVEIFTGHTFRFESYAGYLIDDRTFIIAASCAGVNFLIIMFLMLNAGQFYRERRLTWGHIGISLIIAYVTTLIANTVRIVIALQLLKYDVRIGSFGDEDVHRLEGIVVYFVFLLLLFFVTEKIADRTRPNPATLLRRALIPITIYYIATLAVPLARGAYAEPAFWQHAMFVLIAPLVIMLPVALVFSRRPSE